MRYLTYQWSVLTESVLFPHFKDITTFRAKSFSFNNTLNLPNCVPLAIDVQIC